jgi:hypothetical protein
MENVAEACNFCPVRWSPFGTAATVWPVVPVRDDDDECGAVGGMRIDRGKSKYSEKTFPNATSSTTDPSLPDPSSNPGLRGWKPTTNRLSYDTAMKEC